MMATMDKPWYRQLFSRPQKPDQEMTRPNADYGDAEVQFGMGLQFANGEGAAQDYAQAAEWYRKAAEQSHSLAQFNLGMMYASGQGVAKDNAQSVMWFDRAAQQGDAGAQFNLGRSCHRASFAGLPAAAAESRIEAYKWFHLAAAQGYQGADSGCATLVSRMTHEEVADGNRRAAVFAVTKPEPPQA
jgi:uncharacterized protein